MNNSQLINQDSGNQEYYTDPKIVDAAREVMGGTIHLDPASCQYANDNHVKADNFYSLSDSVSWLDKQWLGNVWLNHPFGRKENPLAINKLIYEYETGNTNEACCITFACTSELWFQPLLDFPMCFLYPRTNYYLPDGSLKKGVTKGSVVTYLGCDVNLFKHVFQNKYKLGKVKI